jgi:HK97 family phage major capsid protein
MATNTAEMRQTRHKLILDARGILDKAEEEKRSLSAEEEERYQKTWGEAEEWRTKIDEAERRNDLEAEEHRELARRREELERAEKDGEEHRKRAEEESRRQAAHRKPDKEDEEERRTLSPFGDSDEFLEEHHRVRQTDEYHRGFCKGLFGRGKLDEEEHRAQVAGKGEKGGYLYASEQFLNELISDINDAVVVRSLARRFMIPSNDSLGVPTIVTKAEDAEWTSELGVPTRTKIVFGKRALTPHPLAKEIIVSKVLVKKAPNIVEIVRGELARVVGEAEENAAMTGHGSEQYLGVFTANNDGIGTARDVSTGNTSALVKFDNLKRVQFTLKQAYWRAARWLMHRDIMGQLAREKDGEGRYLMQDSVVNGDPVTLLLGFPVVLSEFAPHTTGSGNYALCFGDFSWFWIVDGIDMEIVRLEELYARENQDLFIIRAYSDGAPVKAEAFVRSTFA